MSILSKQRIGKCGELLVQLELLKRGVESAPMTTDSGIDLVAYSDRRRDALTIQVKANERPKPGGGTGRLALDWWVPADSPADFVAFVEELAAFAQQQSSGRYHFFMTGDPAYKPKKDRLSRDSDFERFLLERRIDSLF